MYERQALPILQLVLQVGSGPSQFFPNFTHTALTAHFLLALQSVCSKSKMSSITYPHNISCIIYGQGCTSLTNLPSYIDTRACLCGLLDSRSTLPNNGEVIELWRCIGNSSANIEVGGHGKWYNTILPSQELSGIDKPEDWAENPPDLSQTYVLEKKKNNMVYDVLGPNGSPSLIGSDKSCTGTNDTVLSDLYYTRGKGLTVPKSSAPSLCFPSRATESPQSPTVTKRDFNSEYRDSSAYSDLATVNTISGQTKQPISMSPPGVARNLTLRSVLVISMVFALLVALVDS